VVSPHWELGKNEKIDGWEKNARRKQSTKEGEKQKVKKKGKFKN
jgi:hypothetical protein